MDNHVTTRYSAIGSPPKCKQNWNPQRSDLDACEILTQQQTETAVGALTLKLFCWITCERFVGLQLMVENRGAKVGGVCGDLVWFSNTNCIEDTFRDSNNRNWSIMGCSTAMIENVHTCDLSLLSGAFRETVLFCCRNMSGHEWDGQGVQKKGLF